jgi:hypothetical protein
LADLAGLEAMSERQTCHCGHDVSTHYRDGATGERFACLAMGCDCTRYVNEHAPKPKPVLVRPARHPSSCRCARCKAWLEQQGNSTAPDLPKP